MPLLESFAELIKNDPLWPLLFILFIIHWINRWVGSLITWPIRLMMRKIPQKKRTLSKTVEESSQETSFKPKPQKSTLSGNSDDYLDLTKYKEVKS